MTQTRSFFLLVLSFLLAALLLNSVIWRHEVEAASKPDIRAQGAALFADKGCAHCHGPAGFGGSDTGPDLSKVRKDLTKDQIAKQIYGGGENMPPFKDSLNQDEIAALVDYLRSKRKAPAHAVAPSASPASTPAKSDPD